MPNKFELITKAYSDGCADVIRSTQIGVNFFLLPAIITACVLMNNSLFSFKDLTQRQFLNLKSGTRGLTVK